MVYNEDKDKDNNEDNVDPNTEYRESKSRYKIDKTLLKFGKEPYIKFGLKFFKDYCFKNVNTYTKDEFEILFVNKL